jgi:hypothetical protein
VILIGNTTRFLLQKTDNGLEQGGFADAIPTNEADHFTLWDDNVYIAKNMAFAIINIQIIDLEQGLGRGGHRPGGGGSDHGRKAWRNQEWMNLNKPEDQIDQSLA